MQCHRAGFLRGSRLRRSPTADDDAKRRLLEIVCLNCTLDGATLVRELRKPFDVLAEGLISENSRDDGI
jgi:site-specific DNA recombinase